MTKPIIIFFIIIISLGIFAGYKSDWQMCNEVRTCYE